MKIPTSDPKRTDRALTRALLSAGALALAALAFAPSSLKSQGVPPTDQPKYFPLECGMAVATCAGYSPSSFVVGIVDVRNRSSAPLATNWPVPMNHNESGSSANVWNAANLGQVFGVCIDDNSPPNIYVAATSAYGLANPNPGRIHKLDGATGNILPFATIAGVGAPSLGNICYDKTTQQFFVTELEAGLIYCFSSAGAQVATFDHGLLRATAIPPLPALPDNGVANSPTQLGRQVYGVQAYQNRLYYAVINETLASPNPTAANEIWSVQIQPSGSGPVFIPNTIRKENLAIPPLTNNSSETITDIAFSESGKMLIAERGNPHDARNLEYTFAAGVWTGAPIAVGNYSYGSVIGQHNNSAGGVDYDCEDWIYSTGNALRLDSVAIYGFQISPPGGDTSAAGIDQSPLVDLNGDSSFATAYKGGYGDIAYFRCCECLKIVNEQVRCVTNGVYQYTFSLTNNSPQTLAYISVLPFAASYSPMPLSPALNPGQGTTLTLTLTNAASDNFCFSILGHDKTFEYCCKVDRCIALPKCCALVSQEVVKCDPATGVITWNFTLQNNSGIPASYLFVVPEPAGCVSVLNPILSLIPPLGNGQSTNISIGLNVTNSPCQSPCFRVSLHDSKFAACCSFLRCVPLDCKPGNQPPTVDCKEKIQFCDPSAGKGLVLTSVVADANNDPLTVIWKVNGNPVATNTIPAGASAVPTPVSLTQNLPPGAHSVVTCVSDGYGPPVVCRTQVIIGDKEPPQIQCPPDRVLDTWQFIVPNLSSQVVVSDNCSSLQQIKITQDPAPGTILTNAHNCITLTATDAAGNSASCTFCIDLQPFKITGPAVLPGGKPAKASDNIALTVEGDLRSVVSVEYIANGQNLGAGRGSTFRLDWLNVPAGTYSVYARATRRILGISTTLPSPFAYVYVAPSTGAPRSAVLLSAPILREGNLEFQVQTYSDQRCIVEVSESMLPGDWRVIDDMLGDDTVHTIHLNASGPCKFIRVRMESTQ